jgi:hypothetical protein
MPQKLIIYAEREHWDDVAMGGRKSLRRLPLPYWERVLQNKEYDVIEYREDHDPKTRVAFFRNPCIQAAYTDKLGYHYYIYLGDADKVLWPGECIYVRDGLNLVAKPWPRRKAKETAPRRP